MFHLPIIPFSDIEQYIVGTIIVAGTAISGYEYLKHKIRKAKEEEPPPPKQRRRHSRGKRVRRTQP